MACVQDPQAAAHGGEHLGQSNRRVDRPDAVLEGDRRMPLEEHDRRLIQDRQGLRHAHGLVVLERPVAELMRDHELRPAQVRRQQASLEQHRPRAAGAGSAQLHGVGQFAFHRSVADCAGPERPQHSTALTGVFLATKSCALLLTTQPIRPFAASSPQHNRWSASATTGSRRSTALTRTRS